MSLQGRFDSILDQRVLNNLDRLLAPCRRKRRLSYMGATVFTGLALTATFADPGGALRLPLPLSILLLSAIITRVGLGYRAARIPAITTLAIGIPEVWKALIGGQLVVYPVCLLAGCIIISLRGS